MRSRLLPLAAIGFAVLLGSVLPVPAAEETEAREAPEVSRIVKTGDGTIVATLENGLTVIVKPKRTAPVVCVQSFVGAGGLYEGEWLGCGISHLTEHLVAKGAVHAMAGATAESAKQTTGRVDEIGGQSNAYTSLNRTSYYISAASSKANECIALVADWMARPEITKKDFDREHGVVQRELEMGKDDPSRQMWYTHAKNVFGNHPAAVPVIGYKPPLAALSHRDVLDYHAKRYVPQNMVFVIVGDIDPDAALERTRKAFAGFERGRKPSHELPAVEPFSGVRRVVRHHPALKDEMVEIAFQTIPLVHEDLYPLDVLSYILSEGASSRLHRSILREQKLVTEIDTSSWTPAWGTGVFNVSFRCEPGNAGKAEKAILAELETVIDKGVTAEELARAKRQKVRDHVYSQQTVESIAGRLGGDYLATGDVGFSRNYTKRIQEVTAGQVRAAARKYFTPDRMAVTRMTGQEVALGGGDDSQARADAAELLTLPNGLRVVLHPDRSAGLVSMSLVTEGGVLVEDPATNGLGSLMMDMTTRGAGGRSAEEIAEFFANAGGYVNGSCGNNTFYWQASVLDDSFETALAILADVVLRPDFEKKELEILRPRALATIDRTDEHWSSQLQKFFRSQFFQSPYAMLSSGKPEVVKSANVKDLRSWHGKYIRGQSSVLAIFGNFDVDKTRRAVKKLFAKMPGKTPEMTNARNVGKGAAGRRVLKTDNEVAAVIVAQPGMLVTNIADRLPLTVLDTIISGYRLPSGWLHGELRGKQLVYVVHSYNWPGLVPGAFVTYAATQPGKAEQVIEIIHRNLEKAANYTPSQKEIDRAVNTILTAELLEKQSLTELAMEAALDELYGLGHDFRSKLPALYGKITPEDVARVGKTYLGDPEKWLTVLTTPKPKE